MSGYTERCRRGGPTLCLLFCWWLLVLPCIAYAQPIETSPNSPTDWKARYYSLARKVINLEKAWDKRKLDFETAQRLFSKLEQSHEILQASLTASQTDVARLIPLSESLQIRLDAISRDFQTYQQTAQVAIRNARLFGGIVGAAGVIIGILIAVIF